MSFDLYLWRLAAPLTVHPNVFLEHLSNDEGSPCAAPMDRDEVFAAFRKQFPELKDTGVEIDWEGDGSYLQASFTYDQQKRVTSVQLSCGFDLLGTSAFNRIYDAAYDLRCRVLDPQSSSVRVPASEAGGLRAFGALLTRRKWADESV